MTYRSIRVEFQDSVCHLRFDDPQSRNAIDAQMITECAQAISRCEREATIVVIEGLPDVFCTGADFGSVAADENGDCDPGAQVAAVYDVWSRIAHGPFVTIAHVRGRTVAGGVGFAAACDIVLAAETAQFSLSELLFGLLPANVMPFLVRRIGFQRANYLAVTTRSISAREALAWGLVDACDANSSELLRKLLLRMRRISKLAIERYKRYMKQFDDSLESRRSAALAAGIEAFNDADNLAAMRRFEEHGLFPWERP